MRRVRSIAETVTVLTATCHCGAIRVAIPAAPATATRCNCSICRRLGALWAFFPLDAVRIDAAPDMLGSYSWAQRERRFVHCRACGCTTHVEPVQRRAGAEIEVNMRMFDAAVVDAVRVRRFDGSDTWKYLDDPSEGTTPG